MKKIILFLMCTLLLSACAKTNTLHTFSVDARTKDVALENLVIVAGEEHLYIQPTYQLFAIQHSNSGTADLVQEVGIGLYDENNTLLYSFSMGGNQEGFLDTRTTPLEGELIGTIVPAKNFETGQKLIVEFTYEKNNQEIREKITVPLQEKN